MHFVDITTSNTDFMSARERIAKVREKQSTREFHDLFKDRYGGKNLGEVNILLAEMDATLFEQTLGLAPEALIDFIKKKIEERIEAFATKSDSEGAVTR